MLINTNRHKSALLILTIFVVILLLFSVKQTFLILNLKKELLESKPNGVINETADDLLNSDLNCPYYTDKDIELAFANEVSIAYPPKPLEQRVLVFPDQFFDPNADTFDGEFIYSTGGSKQIKIEMIDVSGDGVEEQIVSINTAMNRTPHVALIVKDGKIIFKETGAQTYIYEAGNGRFKVHKTIDHLSGEEIVTSYSINKDNEIIPLWEQKLCNVRMRNN